MQQRNKAITIPIWIHFISDSVLCTFCVQSKWRNTHFRSKFQSHSENKSCLYFHFCKLMLTILVAVWRLVAWGHPEAWSTIDSQLLDGDYSQKILITHPWAPTLQGRESRHPSHWLSKGRKGEEREVGTLITRLEHKNANALNWFLHPHSLHATWNRKSFGYFFLPILVSKNMLHCTATP